MLPAARELEMPDGPISIRVFDTLSLEGEDDDVAGLDALFTRCRILLLCFALDARDTFDALADKYAPLAVGQLSRSPGPRDALSALGALDTTGIIVCGCKADLPESEHRVSAQEARAFTERLKASLDTARPAIPHGTPLRHPHKSNSPRIRVLGYIAVSALSAAGIEDLELMVARLLPTAPTPMHADVPHAISDKKKCNVM
jgi:hypothetical protein